MEALLISMAQGLGGAVPFAALAAWLAIQWKNTEKSELEAQIQTLQERVEFYKELTIEKLNERLKAYREQLERALESQEAAEGEAANLRKRLDEIKEAEVGLSAVTFGGKPVTSGATRVTISPASQGESDAVLTTRIFDAFSTVAREEGYREGRKFVEEGLKKEDT